MKHDPHLANDLVLQSLLSKIAKLEARVAALDVRTKPKPRPAKPSDRAKLTPQQAAAVDRILDRAARQHGCSIAEICGSRGSKRAILARAEACYECHLLGLSSVVTGRAIGNRHHTSVLNLIGRHKTRMSIA